jgi:elongator complex protein 4
MWTPGNFTSTPSGVPTDEDDEVANQREDKIKIAWRYEQMKRFQTTIPSSSTPYVSFSDMISGKGQLTRNTRSAEEYCRAFDLTCQIPAPTIEGALASKRLICVTVDSSEERSTTKIINRIMQVLEDEEPMTAGLRPLRICIPSLGSPQWGDLRSQVFCSLASRL